MSHHRVALEQWIQRKGLEKNMSGASLSQADTPGPKKGFFYWVRRITLVLISAIIMLGTAGGLYQAVATAMDKRQFPPPGQLVDIGGYKLHLYCTGTATADNPTVILEAGLGGTSPSWAWIQPDITKVTRVCAYDRAGMGWSDASAQPRDAQHIAQELHTLLDKAGIFGPYILVGHSYGGLYVHAFSTQYPDAVAGLVLLEAAHPDQYTRTPEAQAELQNLLQMYRFTPFMARLGILRVSPFCQAPADFPTQSAAEVHAWCAAADSWDTQRAEVEAINITMTQVRDEASLGNIPLVVVSAGEHVHANALWAELQNELATLSKNSLHIVVPGATHTSLWTNSEHAHASSKAILDLITTSSNAH